MAELSSNDTESYHPGCVMKFLLSINSVSTLPCYSSPNFVRHKHRIRPKRDRKALTNVLFRPGLRHLAALGKIKIGGPSTSTPSSDFSKKEMHMKTHMCWVCMFFKHNFCVKPYVSRKPRRDPSNRRLNVHMIISPTLSGIELTTCSIPSGRLCH